MSDWIKTQALYRAMFVSYWAHRWAPVGADNDPHNLNLNWSQNVLKLWSAK